MKKGIFYSTFTFLSLTIMSCGFDAATTKTANEVVEKTNKAIVDVEKGLILFTENGCVACHQVNAKMIGPSLVDIAKGMVTKLL
ncbi:MAG TPA: hypothetical protein EYG86_00335 [Crocinitomicaceae bacterium]|nr:hypothetical protein [Crocinitomicaceae bacterium]